MELKHEPQAADFSTMQYNGRSKGSCCCRHSICAAAWKQRHTIRKSVHVSFSRNQTQLPPQTLTRVRVTQMVMPYCWWQHEKNIPWHTSVPPHVEEHTRDTVKVHVQLWSFHTAKGNNCRIQTFPYAVWAPIYGIGTIALVWASWHLMTTCP